MRRELHQSSGAINFHVNSAVGDVAFITAAVRGKSNEAARTASEAYELITSFLTTEKMLVVQERIFGTLDAHSTIMAARSKSLSKAKVEDAWAPIFIQGQPLYGDGLAGIAIQAVRPEKPGAVRTVLENGKPRGRAWSRKGSGMMILQDLCGDEQFKGQRELQAAKMFERANRIIQAEGLSYRDVLRTWIYIDDICDWYEGFNVARTAEYGAFGLIPDKSAKAGDPWAYLPASTGIRGANPYGASCVMDMLVQGKERSGASIAQVANRRQKDAVKYGAAFSRAAVIREADGTVVHVSGTAAIDERGKSCFDGDCRSQCRKTVENIESVLEPQGAKLTDICQATVFLKRAEDLPLVIEGAAPLKLEEFPAVYVVADVCRRELLVEIDVVAATNRI